MEKTAMASAATLRPHHHCAAVSHTSQHGRLPPYRPTLASYEEKQRQYVCVPTSFSKVYFKTVRRNFQQKSAKCRENCQANAALQHNSVASVEDGNGFDSESFRTELEKALQERFTALEKQNIKDIDKKAKKIAEFAIEEILSQSAKLKYVVEKTAVADVNLAVEKSIQQAANDAAASVITDLKAIAEEAKTAIEVAKERARKAEEALVQKLSLLDEQPKPEAAALSLEKSISSLEKQLEFSKKEIQRLRVDAEAAKARAEVAEVRGAKAEATVVELQQRAEQAAVERAENFNSAIESLRSAALAREDAMKASFEMHLAALQAATEASRKAENIQQQANFRRFQALENALAAAERSIMAWKERALNTEGLLQKTDADLGVISGGRMATLLGSETKIADFIENGPRRETPDWMERRIQVALQGIPPRTTGLASKLENEIPLQLPSLDEVWSVANAKVKENDLFSKDAVAKEVLDKQRRDLEQALQTTRKLSKEKLEPGTGSGREIVFQGFNWESCRKRWYLDLAPKAADLSKSGLTTVWLPPPTESVSPQGYMPVDLHNLNSAYGSIDELKHCIQELHKHDLLVLGDVVLNHRCAHKQNSNGVWNVFGGKLAWGPEAIVGDDPNFQGRGNPSTGDIFHAAPNIDHSQDFVRKDIKEYLLWLKSEIGFDGWRLDFVRGFSGSHVKEYIEASNPAFAIGEYWDSLQYEGGNVSYNQDAHRQRIVNWINATGGTSSAFDVTTKGILHAALHNEYWRLIDPQQKPPGVLGWWPSRAVTFLENHDTGSTQGHWPFPREKLMQGYAYILTHPGTVRVYYNFVIPGLKQAAEFLTSLSVQPVVFYDHFYEFGLHDPIVDLIAARKRGGIHCRSPIKIFHANSDGYVAKIGESLVVKLGRLDWTPSKQNNLIGNWERTLNQGSDYQLWERS